MLCRICILQIQTKTRVLDHADYSASTRQHERYHSDQESICREGYISWTVVGIGDLSCVRNSKCFICQFDRLIGWYPALQAITRDTSATHFREGTSADKATNKIRRLRCRPLPGDNATSCTTRPGMIRLFLVQLLAHTTVPVFSMRLARPEFSFCFVLAAVSGPRKGEAKHTWGRSRSRSSRSWPDVIK